MNVDFFSILIAYMVAEILLQPEAMWATKRIKNRSGLMAQFLHQAIFVVCFLLIVGNPGLVVLGVLVAGHLFVDWTNFSDGLAAYGALPSVDRATESIVQSIHSGTGPGYLSLLGASGVIGEKSVHHALHLLVIWFAYKFGPLMGGISISFS